MTHNLLQKRHDLITEMFINGLIDKVDYLKYELRYEVYKKLFIVNLN
jgi:hypothetical protein